ncbi:hypothetical protein [Streptomyces sp. NPDC002221]|uniref:hypothetical protein n=1 Tax=Streptomyces sp. NPDC002221 TaxID=3364639 RepID=UPI0036A9EC5D
MTYTTVDPPVVTEDDLAVQYDEIRSPQPQCPRLKALHVEGSALASLDGRRSRRVEGGPDEQ